MNECRSWAIALIAALSAAAAAPATARANEADPAGAADQQRRATLVSEAAHEQFIFAHRLYLTGRHQHAATAFDEYLEKYPGDEKRGDGLFFRADLALRQGDLDLADQLLEQIEQPRFVKGDALNILRGQVHFEQGRHEQAIAALQRVDLVELGEQTVLWVRHLLGRAYARSGNFPAAAAQFERVVEQTGPHRASALYELAQARAELDQIDAALEAAQHCVELRHAELSPRAAAFAADLAHGRGRYDQVLEFTRAIIENHQGSAQFGRAVIDQMWALHATRRYEMVVQTASQHYNQLEPARRHSADYIAALSFYESGEPGRAAQHLQRIRRQAPGWHREANVLYMLGLCLFELGRYDEMEPVIAELAANHGESEQAARGMLLLARGDIVRDRPERAIGRLGELIDDGPDNPVYADARLQRGHLRERAGQWDEAASDYEAYIRWAGDDLARTPDARLATLRLAHVRFQAGRFEVAERVAAMLLEDDGLEPDMREHAMYQRSQALIRLRQRQEAAAQLDEQLAAFRDGRFTAAAHYWRGVLSLAEGEAEPAIDHLLQAGHDEGFERGLRSNALRMAAEAQRRLGKLAEAREVLERLEQLVGTEGLSGVERLWLARVRIEQAAGKDDHRAALDYLRPLLERDAAPGSELTASQAVEADLLAALGRRELGDLDEAARGLNRVVTRGHGFAPRARLELARTYAKQERIDRAIEEYDMLLRAAGRVDERLVVDGLFEAAELLRRRALEHQRQGRESRAAEDHQAADQRLLRLALMYPHERFTPMPQLALIELERHARSAGRDDDARRYQQQLIDGYPDTIFARYAEAMQELDRGRRSVALRRLEALRDREERLEPRFERIVQTMIERLERAS